MLNNKKYLLALVMLLALTAGSSNAWMPLISQMKSVSVAAIVTGVTNLMAAGRNTFYQLGRYNVQGTPTPLLIDSTASDWTKVSAGDFHACAIRAGQAYCWGVNNWGEIGNGDENRGFYAPSPSLVSGGYTDWSTINAGGNTTCGIRSGLAYCWGSNYSWALGNSVTDMFTEPTLVSGGYTDWTFIDTGFSTSCGIRSGLAYCWGSNDNYLFGDGTSDSSYTPTLVGGGFTDWTSIDSSEDIACGLRGTGLAYCWGRSSAALGNGSYGDQPVPTLVSGGFTNWTKIVTGPSETCGIRATGQAYCWGRNDYGEGGFAIAGDQLTPKLVGGGYTNWTDITVGEYFACGIRGNKAYCWGNNPYGAAGPSPTNIPQQVVAITPSTQPATAITATGYNHSCAIVSGSIYCWGDNQDTQGGNGSTTDKSSPTVVSGGFTNWTQVATGNYYSCGIRATGQAYCWGYGYMYQLGNNALAIRTSPSLVLGGFTNWTKISAGEEHTCGIRATGQAYCWGYNNYGKVGDGTTNEAPTPTLVAGGWTDWTAIGAGLYHSCGIRAGRAYCWGYNYKGQLGNGTYDDAISPTLVSGGFTDWTAIATAAGSNGSHSCGIRGGGILYCWGNNWNYQLGDGTDTDSNVPVPVAGGFTDWTSVQVQSYNTCGIRAGRAYCWGSSNDPVIGDGGYDIDQDGYSVGYTYSPTLVYGGYTDWISVSPGTSHSCGIRNSTIYCWGDNRFGKLGLGTKMNTPQPIPMATYISLTNIASGRDFTIYVSGTTP